MKPSQTAELLARIASFDRRTIGETDVAAWHAAIGDLDFDDCVAAVVGYYQDSREWLMPSDVRQRAKAIRKERMSHVDALGVPDADPDDVRGFIEAQRAGRIRTYLGLSRRDLSLERVFRQVGP